MALPVRHRSSPPLENRGEQRTAASASAVVAEPLISNAQIHALLEYAEGLGLRVHRLQQRPISVGHIVQELYSKANESQKRALLFYLLQSQHYNADYTINESCRLKYPLPLIAPQRLPGYFRTEFNRQNTLGNSIIQRLRPYLERHFIEKKSPCALLKICSNSAPEVLQILYPEVPFTLVFLTPEDLERSPLDVLKEQHPGCFKQKNKKPPPFLFLFTIPETDFGVIWGVKWAAPKKSSDLQLIRLNSGELFRQGVFTNLNSAGACPDRFAFHSALVQTLDSLESLSACCMQIGLDLMQNCKTGPLEAWEAKVAEIDGPSNPASFRHSLLALQKDILAKNRPRTAFLAPQLMRDVAPYLSEQANVGDWAKAAVNLHRILERYCLKYSIPTKTWGKKIRELQEFDLPADSPEDLYRRALLRWQEQFLSRPQALRIFVSSLFVAQVQPWISDHSTIVQWAKGYQNMCEVVIAAIQAFPDENWGPGFVKTTLKALGQWPRGVHRACGLFPYAMSAIFDIFRQVLKRHRTPYVAAVGHNYFETLEMVKKMGAKGQVTTEIVDALEQIQGTPHILVADIHPNNAARESLFQNDVAGWVCNYLNADPDRHLILLLDITLNHLKEPLFQEVLQRLAPFIREGRLEFFGIQSLAKLMQLGADNFSGGGCFYIGSDKTITFPEPIREKNLFFGMMNTHFQDLTTWYFTRVRENTEWMYLTLLKRTAEIASKCRFKSEQPEEAPSWPRGLRRRFCATKVTLNVDDHTVYVAISFAPFLNELNVDGKEREEWVKRLLLQVLALAEQRGLPLTGRQSFGFTLSNMSVVYDAIRFSIGVETKGRLRQYAELIEDFSFALSHAIKKQRTDFDPTRFFEVIKRIAPILKGERNLMVPVSIFEDVIHSDGTDNYEATGNAELGFDHGQVVLDVEGDGRVNQRNIGRDRMFQVEDLAPWDAQKKFHLCFFLLSFGRWECRIRKTRDGYAIGGMFEKGSLFIRKQYQTHDPKTGIGIIFRPEFALIHPNGMYCRESNLYVRLPEFDTPVRLDKLDSSHKSEVFDCCVRHDLDIQDYGEPGTILLVFKEPKQLFPYTANIIQAYQRGGIPQVAAFVQQLLQLEKLPLADDRSWSSGPEHELHVLWGTLKELGKIIVVSLTERECQQLLLFPEEQDCRRMVLDGMVEKVLNDALKSDKTLAPETATTITQFFATNPPSFHIDFEYWARKLGNYCATNPDQRERLFPYIDAILPLIKRETDLYFLRGHPKEAAHFLEVDHPKLRAHLKNLEDELLKKPMTHYKQLSACLETYLYYPPLSNERFLQHLTATPAELRQGWLLADDNFYYEPIPAELFAINMDSIREDIYREFQREGIVQFFFSLGGWNLLPLKEPFMEAILRWAFITQDPEMCRRLEVACREPQLLRACQHAYTDTLRLHMTSLPQPLQWLKPLFCDEGERRSVSAACADAIDRQPSVR